MSRYRLAESYRTTEGKIVKKTITYDDIEKSDSDIKVLTQHGDRFDLLANQFYQDPSLWWVIAKANNMKTNNIPAGKVLRIPSNINL
tara:strand:+ start:6137 stop:6397 length:261 start_codon:yes stop_codon:yes gene_type:complete